MSTVSYRGSRIAWLLLTGTVVVALVVGLAGGSVPGADANTTAATTNQETVTLELVVVEAGSGEPVGGVTVVASWGNASVSTTTQSNGRALVDVPRGARVEITVSDEEYSRSNPYVIENAAETEDLVLSVSANGNAPPTAESIGVTTTVGTSVAGAFDASDPEGDPLGYAIVEPPDHGTVEISGGRFTYRPTAGYTGTDGFRYRVRDGNGGTDTATVTVDVTGSTGAGGVSRVALDYADYGGFTNIEVNGDRRVVDNLQSLDGRTVGGVTVTVTTPGSSQTQWKHLELTGRITSFGIGGQEFTVDNATLGTGPTAPTVQFTELQPFQSSYSPGATIRSVPTGVTIRLEPLVSRDGGEIRGTGRLLSSGKF